MLLKDIAAALEAKVFDFFAFLLCMKSGPKVQKYCNVRKVCYNIPKSTVLCESFKE